jgi:1A family penicillin-binding protein
MSRKSSIKTWLKHHSKQIILFGAAAFFFLGGAFLVWAATLPAPTLQSLSERKVSQSTKIYDRTGTVVLYNIHDTGVKSETVPIQDISPYIQHATVAIEDSDFYNNYGIQPSAILRAIIADIISGQLNQGGSTITQQVVKNVLLTQEKTFIRKIKEMVLAIKLDRVMTKDQILEIYLNGNPYGGNMYGVEEASRNYFGISAKEVDLAQAAYLAALPQAPSYYYPYGQHLKELVARKNLVLTRMQDLGYITKEQAVAAKNEDVRFLPESNSNIKAPHFVMYIRDYLEQKYGKDAVQTGGFKVITTLDWNLQKTAENIAAEYAKDNETKFNASNVAMVGIDPKTGQILVMVGSRDYFDEKHDGNFNIALAERQPGSSFKPFVYAAAFKKGYTPETVLFDAKTQFSTSCDADGNLLPGANPSLACYTPVNYDGNYRGPMTIRNALAQSINIPAIKTMYLVGTKAAISTAQDLGITSLTDPSRYGLTLVLGGGEVSLLEMSSAYGVFADNGVRNPYASILRVEDASGNVLEQYKPSPTPALDPQVAKDINSILSDDVARSPEYGGNSILTIPGREVAAKTGTTNDYRDAWIIGYTPNFVLGAWAGNNDNSPMVKKIAGFIVAPMWNAFMKEALKSFPDERFDKPDPVDPNLKPVLRGIWQGGETYKIDKTTGKLATAFTPPENIEEKYVRDVHDILYWVDRNNPLGPAPANPAADSQYNLWETGVQRWLTQNGMPADQGTKPTQYDDLHTSASVPNISITSPAPGTTVSRNDRITISFTRTPSNNGTQTYPLSVAEFYVNEKYIGNSTQEPFMFAFSPKDLDGVMHDNTLKIVVKDSVNNQGGATTAFTVSDIGN